MHSAVILLSLYIRCTLFFCATLAHAHKAAFRTGFGNETARPICLWVVSGRQSYYERSSPNTTDELCKINNRLRCLRNRRARSYCQMFKIQRWRDLWRLPNSSSRVGLMMSLQLPVRLVLCPSLKVLKKIWFSPSSIIPFAIFG